MKYFILNVVVSHHPSSDLLYFLIDVQSHIFEEGHVKERLNLVNVQSSRGRMDTKWLLQHLKNEKKGLHA
jgi:hypothetical protein